MLEAVKEATHALLQIGDLMRIRDTIHSPFKRDTINVLHWIFFLDAIDVIQVVILLVQLVVSVNKGVREVLYAIKNIHLKRNNNTIRCTYIN